MAVVAAAAVVTVAVVATAVDAVAVDAVAVVAAAVVAAAVVAAAVVVAAATGVAVVVVAAAAPPTVFDSIWMAPKSKVSWDEKVQHRASGKKPADVETGETDAQRSKDRSKKVKEIRKSKSLKIF